VIFSHAGGATAGTGRTDVVRAGPDVADETQMSLTKQRKTDLIGSFKRGKADTGSAEVQIALLSDRISQLTEHFRKHAKDHASRRGLLMMVSRRRRLLDYLKRVSPDRYLDVIKRLNIRK